METTLKKHGNSVGFIIPKPLRDALHFTVGQVVTLEEMDGGFLVKPAKRHRYTLDRLLAQCDPAAPMPASVKEWDDAQTVGSEEW